MKESLHRGLTEEEINDICDNTGAKLTPNKAYLVFPKSRSRHDITLVALERIGISRTPDRLGKVTSETRPKNIREAMRLLSITENTIKARINNQ